MAYDANSKEAILGEAGNDRALELIKKRLEERGSAIIVKRGLKDSAANGELGDILFCRPDEAPLLGIEVKTTTAKYPNSISISTYEIKMSQAKWLMALNEDPEAGVWFQRMDVIREYRKERTKLRNGRNEVYFTSKPPTEFRVPLSKVLDEIQRAFGEIS